MNGRLRRLWLARALVLSLGLQLLFIPAGPAQALNWRLPARNGSAPVRPQSAPAVQRLQEVSPPDWVQRLDGALEQRDPRVRILAPADGSLLADGPWTLRLQVADWPLVDAGPLGLGPHLVVQLDDQPPRPVVSTEVEMPPLSPGSHRLTVYAAKPWGESHKSPTALHQIRVERLAPNPATLPAPGTPQLIAVSPTGSGAHPPLLLDWLLLDAPLQGLRTDSLGWRLRVTLNGESVLLDRQTPLWLRGWKTGSNALLLELLDGRGEPLNPPFNSLLQEVVVAGSAAPMSPAPGVLSPLQMAVLLGDQPLSALEPSPPQEEGPPGEGIGAPGEIPLQSPSVLSEGSALSGVQEMDDRAKEVKELEKGQEEVMEDKVKQAERNENGLNADELTENRQNVDQGDVRPPEVVASLQRPESVPEPQPEPLVTPRLSPDPSALSARQEVNPDGTLKRPTPPSPLQRLRERFQR